MNNLSNHPQQLLRKEVSQSTTVHSAKVAANPIFSSAAGMAAKYLIVFEAEMKPQLRIYFVHIYYYVCRENI